MKIGIIGAGAESLLVSSGVVGPKLDEPFTHKESQSLKAAECNLKCSHWEALKIHCS